MIGWLIIIIEDICIPIGVGCLLALTRRGVAGRKHALLQRQRPVRSRLGEIRQFSDGRRASSPRPSSLPLVALSATYYLYPMSDFHRMEAVLISTAFIFCIAVSWFSARPSIELFSSAPPPACPSTRALIATCLEHTHADSYCTVLYILLCDNAAFKIAGSPAGGRAEAAGMAGREYGAVRAAARRMIAIPPRRASPFSPSPPVRRPRRAGLQPGDILLTVDGEAFADDSTEWINTLRGNIAAKQPGDTLQLKLFRQAWQSVILRDGAVLAEPPAEALHRFDDWVKLQPDASAYARQWRRQSDVLELTVTLAERSAGFGGHDLPPDAAIGWKFQGRHAAHGDPWRRRSWPSTASASNTPICAAA